MNNISIKGLELKAIFALILPSLFLGVADNFLDNVFWGSCDASGIRRTCWPNFAKYC